MDLKVIDTKQVLFNYLTNAQPRLLTSDYLPAQLALFYFIKRAGENFLMMQPRLFHPVGLLYT